MRIEDQSRNFTQQELEELKNFVINELHSTSKDIELLDVIRICNGASDYFGRWGGLLIFKDEQNKLEEVKLFIDLNYYYLKTLDKLKETLAHEYGHHWTLLYYALNQGIRVWEEKLPQEYYQLRGLSCDDYYHDCNQGWERCDKEIIAEDYRILFAPYPYNQEHAFETVLSGFVLPCPRVQEYLINLAHRQISINCNRQV